MKNQLIIGAPFGNWFSYPGAISTLGTFTPEFRAGSLKRLWRILKTVRYYPGIKAWKNKLGLPNPGIRSLAGQSVTSDIVSVSARTTHDWQAVIGAALAMAPLALEMNVSCPNCGDADESDYSKVFPWAMAMVHDRSWLATQIIVKLPPMSYHSIAERAFGSGIANFHCCNTLPTPGGGLSGKPLQPLSLEACRYIASNFGGGILIGGGGVTGPDDVRRFKDAGCTNVSVASVLFWPWKWRTVARMAKDYAIL